MCIQQRRSCGETRQRQNKLFISLLNEIIKIHNCITVSNPFCHPWWLYAAFFRHLTTRVRSFRWINKGKRCVFIVHDFIYHLNPLGRESSEGKAKAASYSRREKFKSLVKTHQFVKCTKVKSLSRVGVQRYQNQDCVRKNNIGKTTISIKLMTWEMFINLQKKLYSARRKTVGSERCMENPKLNKTNQFGFCHLFRKIYFDLDILKSRLQRGAVWKHLGKSEKSVAVLVFVFFLCH